MISTILLSFLGISFKTKLLKKYNEYIMYDYDKKVFLTYINKNHKIIYTYISNDGSEWITIEKFILNGEKFK